MDLQIGSVAELGVDGSLVREFYAAHWPRKIALSNEAFYTWQFRSVPSAPGVDNCVIAFDRSSGEVGGVMGLNARRFSLEGELLVGAELTTWIVHDRFRALGAGAKILAHIQRGYDVLIGMGITDAALSVYLRSGFRYLAAIPRFVKVADFDAVAAVSSHGALARKLAQQWSRQSVGKRFTVSEVPLEADALFDRARAGLNLFIRDQSHLQWRYRDHPFFRYKLFELRSPAGAGAIVALREETLDGGLRVLHVLDCFGDQDAIPTAFEFVEGYCADNRFHAADFYCTSARVNRVPLAHGWFSVLDDKCLQFPHLFHPVELRSPPTTSLIYWTRRDSLACYDFSSLYITKQDADLDRPVLRG